MIIENPQCGGFLITDYAQGVIKNFREYLFANQSVLI